MVTYRCDLFKNAGYGKGDNIYSKSVMQTLKNAEGEEIDREWKNYCVVDDSSKFAAAVYYHYINKEILKDEAQDNKTAYDIDLWGTSSTMFSKENTFTDKLLKTKNFKIYNLYKKQQKDKNAKYIKERLSNITAGDLLYRKGHVEFYIGNNKVIGWGRVNKEQYINKKFIKNITNGYFYSDNYEDNNIPYTTIIRFIGEK